MSYKKNFSTPLSLMFFCASMISSMKLIPNRQPKVAQIDVIVLQDVSEHLDAAVLMAPFCPIFVVQAIREHGLDEHTVKDVAEWPMSKVVAQTCDLHAKDVLIRYVQLRLMFPKLHRHAVRVCNPQRCSNLECVALGKTYTHVPNCFSFVGAEIAAYP